MPGPTRSIVIVLIGLAAISGCATGERPTLVAPPSTVSDPVTAAVIERLDRASTATFTATYDITPTSTSETTTATVVQTGQARRVTIGNVEYVRDSEGARTCETGNVGCVEGFDEARVSNLNITSEFWGRSSQTRLGLNAARAVGPPTGSTETIGGQAATCASIPLQSSVSIGDSAVQSLVYCAIDAGVLARYNGADVVIELTSFTNAVDEALLAG
jgi:hypothetical protein